MRKKIAIALVVAATVVAVALAAGIAWGLNPLGPAEVAMAALESDSMVTVMDTGDFIAFIPASSTPVTGFILYPGGHVDFRSYAPIARNIAGRGYLVSIVEMPFSLAIFGIEKADNVIAAYPDIRYWVIGGHSLGGSMVASYARNHPGKVQGVVFWASYPAEGDDLSGTELKGLTTYGSDDRVLDLDTFTTTLSLLPPGTIMQVIEGGNHSQFGNYGPQPGDGIATITAADQQQQAADLTVRILRSVEGE
ncbi:MAG TPA: alpha/beta hydrolase [Methanoregulaceae archaeon]|nr:alpha/beta hydrolase [Methanoregulaceae archaeon]